MILLNKFDLTYFRTLLCNFGNFCVILVTHFVNLLKWGMRFIFLLRNFEKIIHHSLYVIVYWRINHSLILVLMKIKDNVTRIILFFNLFHLSCIFTSISFFGPNVCKKMFKYFLYFYIRALSVILLVIEKDVFF